MEKKIKDVRQTVCQNLTKIYAVYMVFIFPLFYRNNYIDIGRAKRGLYLWGTGMYCAAMLALEISCVVAEYKKKDTRRFDRYFVLVMALLLSWTVSLLLCGDIKSSFWGTGDKYTGYLLYVLGAISILFIGKYLVWDAFLNWFLIGSCGIVFGLQICNRWGSDPLSMYSNLAKNEVSYFISTLGHVNYNAVFDGLLLSVFAALFLLCKERLSKAAYAVVIFLGCAGAICTCSDSVFLCLFVIGFISIGYAMLQPQKRNDVLLLFFLFLLAEIFLSLFYLLQQKEGAFWGASALCLKWESLLIQFFALVLLAGLFRIQKKGILYGYVAVISAGVILFGILLGIANFSPAGSSHSLPDALVIQDAWGSGRGLIWRKILGLFGDSTLSHKLFGYSFNMVRRALEVVEQDALGISGVNSIMDAHNCLLNSLITSGVVGCGLFVAFLIVLFRDAVRVCAKKDVALLVVFGMASFLAQGLLNGPQIITTPLTLFGLGVFLRIVRNGSQT